MEKHRTWAVVLKKLNYKDSDRLYTLFSQKFGKISALGKGVKKITSRRSGSMDSLNLINIGLYEKSSGGLRTVTEVVGKNSFRNIKKHLSISSDALYICELVHKLLDFEQKNERVFTGLVSTLHELDQLGTENFVDEHRLEYAVNKFEALILSEIGFFLSVETCALCDSKVNADNAFFSGSSGGVLCDKCAKGSLGRISPSTFNYLLESSRQNKECKKFDQVGSEFIRQYLFEVTGAKGKARLLKL
jgi:DNA repair protein RecO (recombination protein O)